MAADGLNTLSKTFQLENSDLSVFVSALGAELHSLYDKHQSRELLWSGNPGIWVGRAPILFPVVGRMRNGGFEYRGKFYSMPIHGFAAHSLFDFVSGTEESLVLELRDSDATRECYPFSFVLQVTFNLQCNRLCVGYSVSNPSDAPLVFSIGSHPAFALPGVDMEGSNAEVRFSDAEDDTCYRIRDGLLGGEEKWDVERDRLVLGGDTFAEDAIILRNVNSSHVSIHACGERIVSIDTGGMPHLGLWAKPNAPYVCIEPWITTDDSADTPLDIEQKPGFVHLMPGQRYDCGYQVFL